MVILRLQFSSGLMGGFHYFVQRCIWGFIIFTGIITPIGCLRIASSPIGDDLMYPFQCLRGKRLRELGHQVATLDTDSLEKFDAAIFLDHPTVLNSIVPLVA